MYAQRTIPALLDFCTRHPRGRQAGRAVPQLLQPDGDEHLGLQPVWRRRDRRPVPRRAGRALADHALHRACGPGSEGLIEPDETLHRRESTSSPPASTTRPGSSRSQWRGMDMTPAAARALREAPDVPADRKSAHRRAPALRLLLHRVQRPPERVPALVSQAHRRDQPLDRPLQLDQRRDRRLPARLHRGPQLVRDRLPQLAEAETPPRLHPSSAAKSTARTSSRRWKPAASIAGTSTSSTTATSPTCRTAASSRSPAMSTATASTCRSSATCRWPAPRPARRASACSRWRWKRPCTAMSRCSSRRCCTTRWSAPSATPKKSGR